MSGDWQRRAKCWHPATASLFSPPRDGKNKPDLEHAARTAARFCGQCPVLADCSGFTDEQVAAGLRPQDLIQAGKYWPPGPAKPPTDLLADTEPTTEDAAA